MGYWLWDAASLQVMRAFVIPRGMSVLAGGTASADATTFTMRATRGDERYGALSNPYLHEPSCCSSYEVTITTGDGVWSYEEDTILDMREYEEPYHHTDRNTLRRVD